VEEVLAVVQQGAEVGCGADGEPHRRQLEFSGGDPGDRQGVDGVGLALELGSPFTAGHDRRYLDHGDLAGWLPDQRQVDRDGAAVAPRSLDANSLHGVLLEQLGEPFEASLGVRYLVGGQQSTLVVDDRYRERVFVCVDTSEQPITF
jgi:hypothetical protein